jgi:tRNA modification GTPase
MTTHPSRKTIVAIATPAGRGGIGIIRISGPDAFAVTMRLCRRDSAFKPRHAHLASWHDDDDEIIDSGLTICFPAPNSYTGEDVVELQGHGSPVIMRSLFHRLLAFGCVAAEPGEFTRRAVENGRMDLSQAEAVVASIDAATERAARQAQRHLAGAFGQRIEVLMDQLTNQMAHVEACLDFPEEEIPAMHLDALRSDLHTLLIEPMQRLIASADFGERLFEGASVAIIGAPNVGKSSLLNRLAGRERAIVSDVAGTTRDTLEIDFDIHGIPVRLVDTAGIRDSSDAIEQEGVRRARHSASEADVVIFVADATRPESWKIDHPYHLAVMNKSDLAGEACAEGFIPVSVKRGDGIESFIQRLADLLGDEAASDEGLYVTSERHRLALEVSLQAVKQAASMLDDESLFDLAALELRCAWSSLGEILGIGDVEYILDRVFSSFCIGK